MQKHEATTFPPRSPHPFVRIATEPDHLLNASSDVGVICDGFRALSKPRPPQTAVPRPPPEAFEHPEEDDPMRAVGRWLDEQFHVSESR